MQITDDPVRVIAGTREREADGDRFFYQGVPDLSKSIHEGAEACIEIVSVRRDGERVDGGQAASYSGELEVRATGIERHDDA